MQTKLLVLPEAKIEYFLEGEGSPVLLLHGAGAAALSNWQTTIEQLSPYRRVIAVNLPGAGNTSWEQPSVGLEALTHLINAVAVEEQATRMDIVGYSTGAMLALTLAGKLQEKVGKVIAIAPWVHDARQRFFFDFWHKLFLADISLFASYNTLTALSMVTHHTMSDEGFRETQHAFANTGFNSKLPDLLKMLPTLDVSPYLPLITARTSIIGFTHDLICPPAGARVLAAQIANAGYREIAAGHAGPWEANSQMNQAIAEWLQVGTLAGEVGS
jgi:pimeloyl-ACP methyl ester carboxylesterase